MTTSPRFTVPAGACDCHMHIYDAAYPTALTALSPGPGWATVEAYKELQKRLGVERAVVVQPTAYGYDNHCTVAAIEALGRRTTRGVAVVGADTGAAGVARAGRSRRPRRTVPHASRRRRALGGPGARCRGDRRPRAGTSNSRWTDASCPTGRR